VSSSSPDNVRAVNEQQLRRHLDEAHRQLTERDVAFRRTEEKIHRLREHQVKRLHDEVKRLHDELGEAQAWAAELHDQVTDMQGTRAWRLAVRLRSLRPGR
jgi:hypothetical protein